MHSRVPQALKTLTLAALTAVATTLGGGLAQASEPDPPFRIVFPQDASHTEFGSGFGDYRSGGRRHKGNDLLAPRMTEVYAVAAGTVIYVGTNHLSGRNIKIEHADGWTSHYVHLNNDNPGTDDGEAPWTLTVAPGIEVGMHVEAGQLIGWVGDSGNAETTTPHTHFELRQDGHAIDPYPLLMDAYAIAEQRQAWLEARLGGTLPYEIE